MKKLINVISISLSVCIQAQAMDNKSNAQLVDAAENGNLELLKKLIEAKANINHIGKFEYSTLMGAINKNNLPCLQALIAAKANVNLKNEYRYSPIMHATICNHLSCVETLIAANSHINPPDSCGLTPFEIAALSESQPMYEVFVEALLHLPNTEQQKKIVILIGLNKYRNKLNSFGFGKNFARTFKPHLRAAIYDQNKHDFESSIAYQEINKLQDGPTKKHLLEKYSNKPDAITEDKSK